MTAGNEANFCVVIPAYQEEGRIGETVRRVLRHCRNVVVVDDGCTDQTAEEAEKAGATVIRQGVNRGKGAALQTGFQYAQDRKFDFLINLDGDGQHDPDDIPRFIEAFQKSGTPVLTGDRMYDTASMPFVRRMTSRFMSWLLSRAMGQRVTDTQSGYRLYRTDVLPLAKAESGRFAA